MPIRSYTAILDLVTRAPEFTNFREIFKHEPLLKFVYHEKCRFPGPICEDRVVTLPSSEITKGYRTDISMPDDEYYPGNFNTFDLKAIWLPLEEGRLFSVARDTSECPLIKNLGGKDHVLFLIHPKSETLYADLLKKHEKTVFKISAISLSSFRSLLIAIPKDAGSFEPAMVKVSLDESIGGVRRLLSSRECALSVANTEILQRRLARHPDLPLNIFNDPLSYVPEGYDYGILYRELPLCLNPKYGKRDESYIIPLLSLFSLKNRDLLQNLVKRNAVNVTDFLMRCILMPFTRIFIDLLINEETSIEAHGQNLLLQLDRDDHVIGLVYRDMGGVNQLISMDELMTLPENLRDPAIYYFQNHEIDAAKALEDHFVRRGLYPLTKQLIKCRAFEADDSNLRQWRLWYESNKFLENWTKDDLDSDEHQTILPINNFLRYGYVENLFFQCFMTHLRDRALVDPVVLEDMASQFTDSEQLPDTTIVPPCSIYEFFSTNIQRLFKLKKEKIHAYEYLDTHKNETIIKSF